MAEEGVQLQESKLSGELGLLELGWAQLSGMLAPAKRECWGNRGPDGTKARELSQVKGLLPRQRCDLQSQKINHVMAPKAFEWAPSSNWGQREQATTPRRRTRARMLQGIEFLSDGLRWP